VTSDAYLILIDRIRFSCNFFARPKRNDHEGANSYNYLKVSEHDYVSTGKLFLSKIKNIRILKNLLSMSFIHRFGLLHCLCSSHRSTESSESSYESDANGERESRISGAFLIGRQSVLEKITFARTSEPKRGRTCSFFRTREKEKTSKPVNIS